MKLRLLLILMFVLNTLVFYSQNTNNPFEIQHRLSEIVVDTIDKDHNNNISLGNPFEVNHVPLRKTSLNQKKEIISLRPTVSNSFIFWVMLFAIALLAIVLTNRRKLLTNLTRSIFNENVLKLTKRQERGGVNLHYILLYIVYFINASVFIYLLSIKYLGVEGIKMWIYIFLGLIAAYLTKHFTIWLLGTIFPIYKETSLYNYCIVIFNLIIGIILIPFNLLLAFGSSIWATPTIFLCLIILGIMCLLRYFRGIFIVANKAVTHIFIFFVYLCTLEIAPLLILMRFLSSFS